MNNTVWQAVILQDEKILNSSIKWRKYLCQIKVKNEKQSKIRKLDQQRITTCNMAREKFNFSNEIMKNTLFCRPGIAIDVGEMIDIIILLIIRKQQQSV